MCHIIACLCDYRMDYIYVRLCSCLYRIQGEWGSPKRRRTKNGFSCEIRFASSQFTINMFFINDFDDDDDELNGQISLINLIQIWILLQNCMFGWYYIYYSTLMGVIEIYRKWPKWHKITRCTNEKCKINWKIPNSQPNVVKRQISAPAVISTGSTIQPLSPPKPILFGTIGRQVNESKYDFLL